MKQTNGLDNVTNIIVALVMIVTLGAIGIFIADTTVTTTALTTTSVNATGNLTITGNPNCGELVSISSVTLYLNTSVGCTATTVYDNVDIPVNTSAGVATNLTTAVNLNSTINSTITATNPTDGVMVITYFITGTEGNAVTTTETMLNGSWINGATLTGGINASTFATMQTNILDAGDIGTSFIVILIIAFIGGMAIMYLTGMLRRK